MRHIDIGRTLSRAWELFARDPLRLILLVLLGSILSLTVVLAPFMAAGGVAVVGRIARRESPELGDLFGPFKEFERYLIGALIWLGAQLLGIVIGWTVPFLGIAITIAVNAFLLCFFPLMVFKRHDGPEAFGVCRQLFAEQWLMLVIVSAIMWVLNWLGLITAFVGLIVVVPFLIALAVATYEQAFEPGDADTEEPQEGEFTESDSKPTPPEDRDPAA